MNQLHRIVEGRSSMVHPKEIALALADASEDYVIFLANEKVSTH